jgi:hypothetical protein
MIYDTCPQAPRIAAAQQLPLTVWCCAPLQRRAYKLQSWTDTEDFLAQLARAGGRLLRGGEPDANTAAKMVLYDWQRGKIPYFAAPPGHVDAPPAGPAAPAGGAATADDQVLSHCMFGSVALWVGVPTPCLAVCMCSTGLWPGAASQNSAGGPCWNCAGNGNASVGRCRRGPSRRPRSGRRRRPSPPPSRPPASGSSAGPSRCRASSLCPETRPGLGQMPTLLSRCRCISCCIEGPAVLPALPPF